MKKSMNDFILESKILGIENLKNRKEIVKDLVSIYCQNDYQNICIVASGSSGNAAECAKLFVRSILNVNVQIISSFTFENYEFDIQEKNMIIVISQSGYSTNSISALKKLKEMNKLTIGITGDKESDFKNWCDILIDYQVGIETVDYVTKGVVLLCEFLMLFAIEAALKLNTIKLNLYDYYINEINTALVCQKEIYDETKMFFENNKKNLLSMEQMYICSIGSGLGVAKEGALKIGETVQIPAIAYELEEYIHGPNLQLTPNYTVFFIDNNDHTSARLKKIFDATNMVTDRTFMISNKYHGKNVISISQEICPITAPLYQIIVFQYLSYIITEKLNKWNKHPMFEDFEKIVSAKSENYKNSPLAKQ